jgi:glucan phosphoethanolaminetransferase (alkaline phosphatase superfamily)
MVKYLMRYLNIRLWGPFYVLGLLIILIMMWVIDEIRPKGIGLWIGSILILIAVVFNFIMMFSEIKAYEDKEDKNRELSGLDPIPKKKRGSLLKRE